MDMSESQLKAKPLDDHEGSDPGKPNPGISWWWLINLIVEILRPLVDIVSPTIRKRLEDFLIDFYNNAIETENPWDDFLARFLLRIFAISIPH
ncbi:hypothetical protein ES703_119558 [subsurface metagenome]